MKKQKTTLEWHRMNGERIKKVLEIMREIIIDTENNYPIRTVELIKTSYRKINEYRSKMENLMLKDFPNIENWMDIYYTKEEK